MQAFKDTAIREALRRRHAAVPPLPDDFDEKVLAAYERQKKEQHSRLKLILWPSIAAAACIAIAFLLGNGVTNPPNLESQVINIKHQTSNIEPQANTAPIAVGTPSEREETASTTQEMVNKIKEKESYFALIEEEQPTVQGAYDYIAETSEPHDTIMQGISSPSKIEGVSAEQTGEYENLAEEAEPEEDMPIYNEADLPITNMENYLYSKDELKKIEQLRKERLIADIKSTVERARYRLEEIEKSFAQN
ncbi:MAG: hypothetical protein J6X27_00295 [Bacteroidaceae bacterium]|nr:hypothetical protein [Bacteroidaceae bacterium]